MLGTLTRTAWCASRYFSHTSCLLARFPFICDSFSNDALVFDVFRYRVSISIFDATVVYDFLFVFYDNRCVPWQPRATPYVLRANGICILVDLAAVKDPYIGPCIGAFCGLLFCWLRQDFMHAQLCLDHINSKAVCVLDYDSICNIL